MIHHSQSDRGGRRLQDNRQTGQSIHPNPPPRSPPRSTMIHHSQSDRGGRRLQDNRQTGQSIHPNPPPRSPPRSTMIHHSQSDRGGLRLQDNRQARQSTTPTKHLTAAGFGFRTIGSLFDSTNHPDQPPYLTTSINLGTPFNHFQSDRGGLRLQDNRQAGQSIHFNQIKSTNPFDYHSGQLSIPIIPLHQPTSSLTVAVFGYTTVGTLVNKSTSINHFQPHRVGPLGLRKNGRLVWSTIHLNKSTSTNPRQQTTSSLTMAGFAFRTIAAPITIMVNLLFAFYVPLAFNHHSRQLPCSLSALACVLPVLSSHLLLATIEALYPRPALNDIANRSIDGNYNIDT
ncbi:hypothetical protein N7524_009821 [Penicillium chrysogenum]|nr:hypothetical protein N7524_009821 [Penicillium chrysogenum]